MCRQTSRLVKSASVKGPTGWARAGHPDFEDFIHGFEGGNAFHHCEHLSGRLVGAASLYRSRRGFEARMISARQSGSRSRRISALNFEVLSGGFDPQSRRRKLSAARGETRRPSLSLCRQG